MFGKKQQGSKPQSRIDSLIGSGTRIEGNVTFSGGLRVDGEIKGNVCAECCGDWDCPNGCECDHGVCSCHCGSDYDCPKGTCCCKSGACSADCCPKPPKPPKPQPKPDAPVTTLPATGSGDTARSSGLLGVAALGAAAVLAAKRLRETPSEE